MGLQHIAPHQRGLFRWHAVGLALWLGVVGAASTALLYRAGVHGLSTRYALTALLVYGVGFLLGGWVYARWWSQRSPVAVPEAASLAEQTAYSASSQARWRPLRWLDSWGFPATGADDVLSAFFTLVGLLLLALATLWLLGVTPWLLTEFLGGFLAEVVLECVAAGAVARRMAQRGQRLGQGAGHSHADYWPHMLGKTLWAGLGWVLAAWVLGWCLQAISPEAQTLGQAVSAWFH